MRGAVSMTGSVSNAGRQYDISLGSPVANNSARRQANAVSSISAAVQLAALQQQQAFQNRYGVAPSPRAKRDIARLEPTVHELQLLDDQRIAAETMDDGFFAVPRQVTLVREAATAVAFAHVPSTERHRGERSPTSFVAKQSTEGEHMPSPTTPAAADPSAAPGGNDEDPIPPHGGEAAREPKPSAPASPRVHAKPLAALTAAAMSKNHETSRKPTSSFLAPERPPQDSLSSRAIPPVGHYRPKTLLTETGSLGGYIQPRSPPSKKTFPEDGGAHQKPSDAAVPPSTAVSLEQAGSYAVKSTTLNATTATTVLTSVGSNARLRTHERLAHSPPRPVLMDPVFRSLSPRLPKPGGTAAPDTWYWPRNDMHSTHSGREALNFSKLTPRTDKSAVAQDTPDAYYKVLRPFGADSLATMLRIADRKGRDDIDGGTSSNGKRPFYYQDHPLEYDINRALDATRASPPGGRSGARDFSHYSPRRPMAADATEDSVALREGFSPKDVPSQTCRPLHLVPFSLQRPRDDANTQASVSKSDTRPTNEVYDVSFASVERSTRVTHLHPSAPGHLPLHRPSETDIGALPSYDLVKPHLLRRVDFEKQLPREDMTVPLHDLQYDTSHVPSDPRTLGNPRMSTMLTREKRERALRVKTNAPEAIYDVTSPVTKATAGANLDFARQISREVQFSGREMPSEKYVASHPRAPPVGSYDVHA